MVILLVNSYLKIKVEDYFDTETGMGAHVGRNANRIKGACVNIEGVDYKLDANEETTIFIADLTDHIVKCIIQKKVQMIVVNMLSFIE